MEEKITRIFLGEKCPLLNEKTLGSMFLHNLTGIEFGRRRSNELVFVMHGWLAGATHTEPLARAIREELGYSTLRLDLSMTFGSMEGVMAECHKQLSGVNFGKDFLKVHFVAHSMGGLLAKIVLNEWDFPNARSLVSLGTPFSGSKVLKSAGKVSRLVAYTFFYQKSSEIIRHARKPLKRNKQVRIGSIAGRKPYKIEEVFSRANYELRVKLLGRKPNDGTVLVDSALGLGELSDKKVVDLNHLELVTDPPIKDIGRFLRTGKF